MQSRKYQFKWELIGDVEMGRPNLGHMASVEMLRLFQFTLKDVMEKAFGTEKVEALFTEAGYIAGKAFYEHYFQGMASTEKFFDRCRRLLIDLGIGYMNLESQSEDAEELLISIDEDLECSGLPVMDYEMCQYTEGVLSGLFEAYRGVPHRVEEIDCWCTGDRTCRFKITKAKEV